MPPKDSNNIQNRFRSAPALPPRRRFMGDIQPPARRKFPAVGTSLPPYRSLPGTPALAPASTQAAPRQPIVPPRQSLPPSRPLATSTSYRPSPAPAPKTAKKRRRIFTRKRVALVIILIVLGVGGWVGGKLVYNTLKVFHGSVFSLLTTTKLKGESTGRVNILLAGNSADDPGHDGANLTDSIMIVSIDTKDHTAFLLSVPRDLWVDIPGYGHAKINEAYVDGQAGGFSAAGYPSGGMGLLEEVVQQNFGIPINYYALIDYNGLRDAVNAVGGIDVNIQSDDPRGLYDPSIDYATNGPLVNLSNGMHHLDGEQALDLARARGDAYGAYGFDQSDFDRTEHQRLMILALKSKVLSAGVLANPVSLSNLFDSIGKNVHTDFSLSEARRLYDIGKGIGNGSIQSVSLNDADGTNLLANYESPNGESALTPAAGLDDFSKIQLFVKRLTTNNPVLREGASVVVLNATNTSGLAAQVQQTLVGKDVNVTAIGDAQASAGTTTIIDASAGKKPATLALLKNLYGTSVTTVNPYAGTYNADFIVVLGGDQAASVAPAQ